MTEQKPSWTGYGRTVTLRPDGARIVMYAPFRYAIAAYRLRNGGLRSATVTVPLDGSGDEAGTAAVLRRVGEDRGTIVDPAQVVPAGVMAWGVAARHGDVVIAVHRGRRVVEVFANTTWNPADEYNPCLDDAQWARRQVPLDGSGDDAAVAELRAKS